MFHLFFYFIFDRGGAENFQNLSLTDCKIAKQINSFGILSWFEHHFHVLMNKIMRKKSLRLLIINIGRWCFFELLVPVFTVGQEKRTKKLSGLQNYSKSDVLLILDWNFLCIYSQQVWTYVCGAHGARTQRSRWGENACGIWSLRCLDSKLRSVYPHLQKTERWLIWYVWDLAWGRRGRGRIFMQKNIVLIYKLYFYMI